jgi:MerR family transcriptional regulator, light-induced transcriptional regulator
VLLLDAAAPLELDELYAQSLELMLRRAGVRTLSLSTAITGSRLARALPALAPSVVVLAGRSITLDALGRLVYSVRSVVHGVQVFDFRGAVPDTGASTVRRLGQAPLAARDLLLGRLEGSGPYRSSTPARPLPALTAR